MGRGLRDANVAADLFEHEKPRQAPAPDHEGHRQRLKDRFAKAGPGALHDYELLE
jgi:DNA repair protein RadC